MKLCCLLPKGSGGDSRDRLSAPPRRPEIALFGLRPLVPCGVKLALVACFKGQAEQLARQWFDATRAAQGSPGSGRVAAPGG